MKIHFFNTRSLATQLALGKVDELLTFQYFFANNILWTLTLYYGLLSGAKLSWLLVLEIVIVIVITVLGLRRAFDANGGPSGQGFVIRATCLLFPIGIKITVASIALGWVNYFLFPIIIDPMSFREPERVYDLVTLIWAPIFTAILFWRLRLHITSISRQAASNE